MLPTLAGLLEYVKTGSRYQHWVNDRGNTVHGSYSPKFDDSRYTYDEILNRSSGWAQYDTDQDAHYFGVWVSQDQLATFTYCEGDISLVECPDLAHFKAELANAAEVYGEPPPAFISLDDDGTLTKYYDTRPT